VRIDTNVGSIVLELFVDETPQTVAAFLDYVTDESYVGSIFHRSVSDFVVQGGGFAYDEAEGFFDLLPNNGPIENEPGISNLERTVAMARVGGDIDSATRQFFFNLNDDNADGPARLDFTDEGFTVFAQVVDGWDTVLEIAGLPTINGGGAFTDLPVRENFDNDEPLADLDAFVTITGVEVIYANDGDERIEPGATVLGAADSANRATLVSGVTSGEDRVQVFQLDPGTNEWTSIDLLEATGRDDFDGALDTFTDPTTGRTSVVAAGGDGVVVYQTTDGLEWTATDITGLINGAEPIASDVTTFTSNGGVVYVAGLTSGGDYVVYTLRGDGSGQSSWGYENISRTDLAASGATLPELRGNLISYVTSWGGLNVAGLDAEGDIWALWTGSEIGSWNTSNLSAITGAPAYEGELTVFLTTWGAINLAGVTTTGNVVATWWLPQFEGQWRQADLTIAASAGTVRLSSDSISSFVTPWGALNVAGLDALGNVVAYWWSPTSEGWNTADLSAVVPTLDRPTGSIRGFTTPNGVISLVGADDEGDVVRYAFNPATFEWSGVDVSAETGIIVN
ncbi:MAG: peptidylprolyl isomerase, partial [Planctomycetota bacterium]